MIDFIFMASYNDDEEDPGSYSTRTVVQYHFFLSRVKQRYDDVSDGLAEPNVHVI